MRDDVKQLLLESGAMAPLLNAVLADGGACDANKFEHLSRQLPQEEKEMIQIKLMQFLSAHSNHLKGYDLQRAAENPFETAV
jgi:hypothetical protein